MRKEDIVYFENKFVAIKTKTNTFYNTKNLIFCETYITFNDKYGSRVILDIDDIASISEIKKKDEGNQDAK